MGSKNAKPPPPGPGRPHGLLERYVWPGNGEVMTVGEAIPRQMRTVGCTWDEAGAFVGIPHRTMTDWLYEAAKVHRHLSAGADPATLTPAQHATHKFLVDLNQAAAEVTIRWQGILESEGRGGYPVTRKTVVERRGRPTSKDPDGVLIERRTETVTETARPDVKAVIWKMQKQLRRYRDRPMVFVAVDGVEIPEPDDEELAGEVAARIRTFQARPKAIDATAVETNGHT